MGVEGVARRVQTVVDGLGDALADLPETLGGAVERGLAALAAGLRASGGLAGTLAWLGEAAARLANLGGALFKAGFGLLSGLAGGALRLLGGLLALDGRLALKGLVDLGSNLAGGLIVFAGNAVCLVQRLFFVQGSARPLNAAEQELLRKVFRDSLALYNIRLVQGRSGVFGANDRAFTLANTIYMKDTDPARSPEILVHECVHVWQYQHGGSRYTSDALGAQAIYKDAYDWRAEASHGRSNWRDFNKEAQAKLIQDVWFSGSLTLNGKQTTGSGCFYDLDAAPGCTPGFNGSAETDLAVEAVRELRKARSARLSSRF